MFLLSVSVCDIYQRMKDETTLLESESSYTPLNIYINILPLIQLKTEVPLLQYIYCNIISPTVAQNRRTSMACFLNSTKCCIYALSVLICDKHCVISSEIAGLAVINMRSCKISRHCQSSYKSVEQCSPQWRQKTTKHENLTMSFNLKKSGLMGDFLQRFSNINSASEDFETTSSIRWSGLKISSYIGH